jgi:hypothetical protein
VYELKKKLYQYQQHSRYSELYHLKIVTPKILIVENPYFKYSPTWRSRGIVADVENPQLLPLL